MLKNLTIERTTVIIAFLLLGVMALRVPIDTDTWWHIRSGEYTLNNVMIYTDPFSHSQLGERWINHSWGAQVVMYAIWQLGGNIGLALYTIALSVGGMAFLYPISRGNAYVRVFMLILGAAAAAVFWSARPQMFSFFFSTVILFLVYHVKQGGKNRLWLIVPIMWLWANLHAGYSIGYLFLIAFIVGEAFNNWLGILGDTLDWKQWRILVISTLISIPVLALSPYGINTLLVPFETVGIDTLREFIQEWNSPNFQGRETYPFIAMVMLLFASLWASNSHFDWSGLFLLVGTLLLALWYGRNIAVFAVVATPILTHHADSILTRLNLVLRPRRKIPIAMAILNLVLITVVALGALVYAVGLLLPANIEATQEEFLPIEAVNYLNDNDLPPNMFNSYNWGGYLLFAAPEYPVFIDGRTDLYGEFLRTYFQTAIASDGWRETLAEYGIQTVLVENGSGLDLALREEPDWQLVYEDDLAVIHTTEAKE